MGGVGCRTGLGGGGSAARSPPLPVASPSLRATEATALRRRAAHAAAPAVERGVAFALHGLADRVGGLDALVRVMLSQFGPDRVEGAVIGLIHSLRAEIK